MPRPARRVLLTALLLVPFALGGPAVAGSLTAPARAAGPSVPRPGHVFLIEIENKSFDEAYVSNPHPYLRSTLPAQGQLLTQYHGIGHVSLPNYLAQLSGQAPNPATQSDCQTYVDFTPGAVLGTRGQAAGAGCVFPASVRTLPDQLTATGHTWKAYMGDMGNDTDREDDRCGAPANSFGAGGRDGTQSATAKDQYAARHNPFVYFHSVRDSELCHTNVVPLTQLAADLASPADFTWITPNLCDDGHDDPCVGTNVAGGKAGGLAAVDLFLRKYVPLIEASPAFRKDGLLVITSDESENDDATACCGEQPGPNSPLPGITGPGGGRIGTLVIGPCVRPGTRNELPYNHYSLLRSLEDHYGITTGGSDGKGHLGEAGAPGLASFGADVYGRCAGRSTPAATPVGSAGRPGSPGTGPGDGGNGGPASPGGAVPLASRGLAATGGSPLAPVAAGSVALFVLMSLLRRRKAR
jgi:phosphatidylinositol-3-phosphatase